MEKKMKSLVPILHPSQVTTIDVNQLRQDSRTRPLMLQTIHDACQNKGFFQIVNHGISQGVIDDALGSLSNFFESAMEEKKIFLSDDVKKPVRFGTSRSNGDAGKVSRDFIKLYANPIEDWIVDGSKLGEEPLKLMGSQRFSEYISQLIEAFYVMRLNHLRLYLFTDIVTVDFNMLRPLVKDGV
nr:flavanone 3-dioxygenase 3-like [Malus domestica]